MTRPDRPDDDHDDALHQAWRASSREAPPPALDAAILAAAHRAVGSAPRTAGGEAVRPPRWWMPFAAAAVIGAVAVGVVQLAPHESAIDVTSGESAKPDARVAIAPAAGAGIAVERPATATTPATGTAPSADRSAANAPASAPTAEPPASAPPPASPPASAMSAAGKTTSSKREASPPVAVAPAPPLAPAPSPAPRAQVDAAQPSLAATPAPQPFPAAKVARQEPAQDSAAANPASANRMADAAIPRESAEARASPRSDAQGRVAASPPPPSAPAPARAAATAPTAERARDGFAGNLAQVAKQRPAPSAEALERAKDPEAWIVRIRKLRDGGREAEAIKELHEFDALVPDAAQRMPSELRRLMQRDPVN